MEPIALFYGWLLGSPVGHTRDWEGKPDPLVNLFAKVVVIAWFVGVAVLLIAIAWNEW